MFCSPAVSFICSSSRENGGVTKRAEAKTSAAPVNYNGKVAGERERALFRLNCNLFIYTNRRERKRDADDNLFCAKKLREQQHK